jgi:hypothetical protein
MAAAMIRSVSSSSFNIGPHEAGFSLSETIA